MIVLLDRSFSYRLINFELREVDLIFDYKKELATNYYY